MKAERTTWLDDHAVTCRVFKGKWNIRHCLRMRDEMGDLKIRMATRANGAITRHESAYNPCDHCKVLANHLKSIAAESPRYDKSDDTSYNQVWAV